jgi:predicted TIM-barrel fold metal-dependent hydrolase
MSTSAAEEVAGIVIDEHRHIGYAASRPARTAADIVAELDRLGVQCAVVIAGAARPATRDEELAADEDTSGLVEEYLRTGATTPRIEQFHRHVYDQSLVFEAVAAHPGRLIGAYILNPWLGDAGSRAAREAVEGYGFRYLKLHPWTHAFAPDDLRVMGPVAELALQLDVPLWFHTSYGPGAEPERPAQLAAHFPRLPIIMGHVLCGGRAGEVAALMQAQANLWADLAEASEDAMRALLAGAPAGRIMLASDDPWGFPLAEFSLEAQIGKVKRVTAGRPELRRAILGGNAAGLLRLQS